MERKNKKPEYTMIGKDGLKKKNRKKYL